MAGRDPKPAATFAGSAPRTASGTSAAFTSYGSADLLRCQLDVTAASGTAPTLDAVIEDSLDGVTWNVIGAFAQKLAVGREVINITTPFADMLRTRWTVAGTTPSFTFSVLVEAQ
ncbi:MAG: hypothetical protein KY447_09385 [Actinobacteria bacterium]|nr:hypothetical protein [Actinomycetota bacterium]